MSGEAATTAFVTGATGFLGSELIRLLVARGCQVFALAGSAESARHLRRGGAVAVAGDLRVPGRSGIEIYDSVAAANPALARRFILISGDAASSEVRAFRERTGMVILEKPFELRILGAAIERTADPGAE